MANTHHTGHWLRPVPGLDARQGLGIKRGHDESVGRLAGKHGAWPGGSPQPDGQGWCFSIIVARLPLKNAARS